MDNFFDIRSKLTEDMDNLRNNCKRMNDTPENRRVVLTEIVSLTNMAIQQMSAVEQNNVEKTQFEELKNYNNHIKSML